MLRSIGITFLAVKAVEGQLCNNYDLDSVSVIRIGASTLVLVPILFSDFFIIAGRVWAHGSTTWLLAVLVAAFAAAVSRTTSAQVQTRRMPTLALTHAALIRSVRTAVIDSI
jgi:hypothetical protein